MCYHVGISPLGGLVDIFSQTPIERKNKKEIKKMKKRNGKAKNIICILLCILIFATITGCSPASDSNSNNQSNSSVSNESSKPDISDKTASIPLTELQAATPVESKSTDEEDTIPWTQLQKATSTNSSISPFLYQKLLGKGMDVDWAKTSKGQECYNEQAVIDFKDSGISHVRIRIKDKADDELFSVLDKIIEDCLKHDLIPIIAYQADEFKNEPTQKNIEKVVKWWTTVAERYQDKSNLLSFDLLIEATDALNKQPEKLNEIYELLVTEIQKTNPTRIIMMSPRLRSDAACLSELKVPTNHNGYMMAEWHFYAAGPSKTNERKLWTTGTEEEMAKITEKIELALQWQNETGIPTWVGAWMAGNYNDGDDYTIEEQVVFAEFMTKSLSDSGIPFAVNSDTKFYDRENNQWIEEMQPVFKAIYK